MELGCSLKGRRLRVIRKTRPINYIMISPSIKPMYDSHQTGIP